MPALVHPKTLSSRGGGGPRRQQFTQAGEGKRLKSTDWLAPSALPTPYGTLGSQGALCFLRWTATHAGAGPPPTYKDLGQLGQDGPALG